MIFQHTLVLAVRQKQLMAFAIILIILYAAVAINSSISYKAREAAFEKARNAVRTAWLGQGETNPHNSAHYGHYIFQPISGLQFLDNGIRNFSGSVLRLEAHAQHEPAFSPAEDRSEMSRLGEIHFAWMLQVLTPLFIILLCFNAVVSDREQQNLKMLLVQGLSPVRYLWGRILGLYTVVAGLFFIGLIIQVGVFAGVAKGATGFSWPALITWAGLYAVYLFIITAGSVLISSWVKNSSTSLTLQLGLWVLMTMIVPRISASAGESLFPLEQKSAFNQALREDREKGINGHDPADKRYSNFMDSLLKHYQVDTISDLKINADGLIMQADEDYANLVYDKHFNRIREIIARQNNIGSILSLGNPYLAVRNLSMAISQSDYRAQLSLFAEAEQYRRYLIRELNTKMAYGGSKTGDWDWTVDAKYWETVKDFSYPSLSLAGSLQNNKLQLAALGLWLLLILSGILITARNLKIL